MTSGWTASRGVFIHMDGCEVSLIGRAGYRYVDQYGEYFADGELLMGNPDAVVLSGQIYKIQDGISVLEFPKRRKVIAGRIREALQSQGYQVDIVDG